MENYKVQRKISTHLEDLIRANVDIIFPKRLDFGKRGDMPHHTTLLMLRHDLWLSLTVSVLSPNQIPGADVGTGQKRAFLCLLCCAPSLLLAPDCSC